jgi:heme A synthase
VGGITRLTGSGLSMVDWRPIAGILPPITDAQWDDVFGMYQGSPEYQKVNKGMSLDEFKFIFLLGISAPDTWTNCGFALPSPIPVVFTSW